MKSGLLNEKLEMVKDDVIAWRRYLHQYPELSFQEEKTSQFVYETLQSFGNLELSRPTRTSVVARLLGREPGKVLAMRADMDALPIQEENEFPFASQNPGIMHACGHDGHTAMLLGAAKILSHWKDQIKGEIRFIFQHAEELPPGGAQEMVKEGVMEGVDRVIGIHLMSTVPFGEIGIGYGTMTSANDTFGIRIQGKGGHSSMPNDTIDPIAIGAQVVSNLQHIASRNCDPMEKFVLSVTSFHGGDALNVIPDTVTLGGSVRSFNPKLRDHVPELMEKIIKGITEAHGASYQFDYQRGYSPVINDDKVTNLIEETILDVWGEDTLLKIPPMMGSEDFSSFANEVLGCFIFVGAGNWEKGIIYPHHHPKFTVDEDSLEIGVKLFVNSAFKLLDAQ